MRNLVLVLPVVTVLLLLPAGCGGGGGGGGGGGPATDALLGTYKLSRFVGLGGPPLTAGASWRTDVYDGLGGITNVSAQSIVSGVLGVASSSGTGAYRIQPGNVLEIMSGATVGSVGGLSADGALLMYTRVSGGAGATLTAGAREEGGLSTASLSGRYHYAQFAASPTSASDATFWGWVDFDGAGNASYTLWHNEDGSPSAGSAPVSGTYSVTPSGALTLSLGPAVYTGSVARGGMLGFFSGSTVAGGIAGLGLLIKYSTSASVATFSGSYHLAGIFADASLLPAVNWRALTGTMSSDGAGQWGPVAITTVEDDGTVATAPGPFMPAPYTVAANGGIGFGDAVGAVASDGSVAALVGPSSGGSGPILYIMLR